MLLVPKRTVGDVNGAASAGQSLVVRKRFVFVFWRRRVGPLVNGRTVSLDYLIGPRSGGGLTIYRRYWRRNLGMFCLTCKGWCS